METASLIGQIAAQCLQQSMESMQVSAYASPDTFIANKLLSIEGVESVYIDRTKNVVRIWTVIDSDDIELRNQIYACERRVIQELALGHSDFHVVARRGRQLRDIITLVGYPLWTRL